MLYKIPNGLQYVFDISNDKGDWKGKLPTLIYGGGYEAMVWLKPIRKN